MRNLDRQLFELINGWAYHSRVVDHLMMFWAQYAPEVFAALLVALWLTWRLRSQMATFIAAGSAFLALGIGQLIGRAFPRPRPFAADGSLHAHLLVPHVADASFPSDHATLAAALIVVLWRLDRRLGIVLSVVTLWLMIARVYIGAHYPTDLLGGAALGAGTAWVVLHVVRRRPLRPLVLWLFDRLGRLRLAARGPRSPSDALHELVDA